MITQTDALPQALSSDNDPLFESQRWKANLRILDVREIRTVLYVSLSHPFIEGLIGTIQRELLDHTPLWTSTDLERELTEFKNYYNRARTYRSLGGTTPVKSQKSAVSIDSLKWNRYCRGLYLLPIAA